MFKKASYVYAIYTEGSFTKAAQKLYISQPCLSAAVKQIEEKVGAPLFERSSNKVKPTQLGLQYIQTAEQILGLEEAFLKHLQHTQTLESGTVRVGGSNYVASHILPGIIDAFSKQHPNVVVTLTEASSSVLRQLLQAGDVDLIMDSFDDVGKDRVHYQLAQEQILLAVPKAISCTKYLDKECVLPSTLFESNTLPKNIKELPLQPFADIPFILLKSGNSMYDHAMDIFRINGITPKIHMFLDQLATSYFLATQGDNCCFVTDTLFRYHKFEDSVRLYKIKGCGTRSLDIAHRRCRQPTPAEKRFIEISQQLLQRI